MSESGAARFVGSIPDFYDRCMVPVIFADYATDIARRAAARGPSRVLETAAGTGAVTRALRDALPAGTALTATDLNPPMLEIAARKFRPGECVAFQPADATALPFADASFDAVVCQFGVMFYPDKARSYREVRRVLAPSGRYLFNVWDAHRHNAFGRLAFETVARFFPDDPPQFHQVPFGYSQIDPIKEALLEAGFTDIRVDVVALAKPLDDPGEFARGLIFGTPLIEQLRTRGGVDPEEVVAALAAEYALLRRDFRMQAIVIEAG